MPGSGKLTWDRGRPPTVIVLGRDQTVIGTTIVDGSPALILIPTDKTRPGRTAVEQIDGMTLPPEAVIICFATPKSVVDHIERVAGLADECQPSD